MKTVLIILGSARSGSTLLGKTIGGHSDCFAIGEINRFLQEIHNSKTQCGCSRNLTDCIFWNKIKSRIKSQIKLDNFLIDINNKLIKLDDKLLKTIIYNKKYRNIKLNNQISNTLRLYEMIFEVTKNSILIDSSKSLFRALILASQPSKNIQFKFIHLTRDGRGVLYSKLKSSYSITNEKGELITEKKINNKSPIKIINSWLYINIRNFIILKIFNRDKTFFLKYESFTKYPSKYLFNIFSFLNLGFEENVMQLDKNENHILGGNSSRINAKIIKKQDDKWKVNLDKDILNRFNSRAGWFNRLLGYPKR